MTGSIGSFAFTPSPGLVGGPHILVYTYLGDVDCDPLTDTLRVTVLPPGPTASAPADTALCAAGPAFRLRGGTPAGGTWAGPGVTGAAATGFFFTPSSLLRGAQLLTYTAPPGASPECPARANRTVTLDGGAWASLTAPDTVVCVGAGPQPLLAVPPGGTWAGPGVTGSGATGFVFTPSPALAGRPLLTYAGPAPADPTQCAATGSLRLRVVPLPLVAFAPVAPIGFCPAAPPHGTMLMAGPPGGTFGGPGVVGNRFVAAEAGPGRHVLTYTWAFDGRRCPVVATQLVTVTLVPPIRLPADTVLCTSQGPFQLRASPAGGTWRGPGVTPSGVFTPPAQPGTTALHYDLLNGCPARPYRVTVPTEPTFVPDWTVPACAGNDLAPRHLRFQATGTGAALVRWEFGDGSAPVTGAVVEHTYGAGHYQPVASLPNQGGPAGLCPREVALPPVEVRPAQVPNIITPNHDGLNDTFAPALGGCPGRLRVFSRWGQPVVDRLAYRNDWAGEGLPAGVYYYLLTGPDPTARVKGWVEIVR